VIRLAKDFVERHGKDLSVSRQFRQVKFRIDRRNGTYQLGTRSGPVNVTAFVDPEPLDCPPEVEHE
jgi:hypothetical protein